MYTGHDAKGLLEKQSVANKLISEREEYRSFCWTGSVEQKETTEDDACTGRGKANEGILTDLPLIPIPDQCRLCLKIVLAEDCEGSSP